MKNLFTLLFALFLTGAVSAQPFWTETFGTTCQPRGNQAYTGPNGAWTITSTGANQPYGNDFYINDRIMYNGVGSCAIGNAINCQPSPNNSLHIGGKAIALVNIPVDSASYWTGFYCSFGLCATTNRRAESPTINCSGKTSIVADFLYYEGGDNANGGANGDATMWYSADNGTNWTKISELAKTPRSCSGTMYGVFTAFTVNLPSSADNNPNVKIGFNWTNNDVSGGTDPSFAVDSIRLSGSGSVVVPPVAAITSQGTASGCAPIYLSLSDNSTGNPTSWKWTFTGATPSSSTLQNPGVVQWSNGGQYSIKLKVTNSAGSDSTTLTNFVTVQAAPPTPTITRSNDTLCSSYDASYTSYQWYQGLNPIPGATNPCIKITQAGNYNLSVKNSNNCEVAVGITVGVNSYTAKNTISLFPSPANDAVTITGNWQTGTGVVSLYDILGNKVKEELIGLDQRLTYNIKGLSQGVYFIQIQNEKGTWTGRLVKE